MLYVGIDVAKNKHDCCIIDSDGVICQEPFLFENNRMGYDHLKETIESLSKNEKKVVKIGLEPTGHYSINITEFFVQDGYNVISINPLLTNLYRKARTLRKTKTDKTDAMTIAQMLTTIDHESYVSLSYQMTTIKSLARFKRRTVNSIGKLRVSVKRLLTIVFPEYEGMYNVHTKGAYAILKEYPDAKAIAESHIVKLTNILKTASRGSYGKKDAMKIRTAARNSVGQTNYAYMLEMKQTIEQIEFLEKQEQELEKEIKALMKVVDSKIETIPGVGPTLGAIIISEIGDIRRFSNVAKLVAYAGLDASTTQSGESVNRKGKMVKRGSKHLRWAIMEAARLAAIHDEVFKAYFNKKLAEGKLYRVALSHVAKKLLRVIYAMLNRNEAFSH